MDATAAPRTSPLAVARTSSSPTASPPAISLGVQDASVQPTTASAQIPMLPFHRAIIDDLSKDDGLVIVGRGLGLSHLVFHLVNRHISTPRLVLLLNVTPNDVAALNAALAHEYSQQDVPPQIVSITNTISVQHRIALYNAGGCIAVTNRILVVDLLNATIHASLINGIIITQANRVIDTSAEAFIIRLYRQGNTTGFIHALSDDAPSFLHGFYKLDRIMKALTVRALHLYPRFRTECVTSLTTADVTEWKQPLTLTMENIQRSLLECMEMCLSGLKQENKSITSSHLTLENGLTKAFDVLIRHELDPIWHKVSNRTKQLLTDLTALRSCLTYLISYDALTFYRYLLGVRSQSSHSRDSLWIFTEPADRLYKLAKDRVYIFHSPRLKRLLMEMKTKPKQSNAAAAKRKLKEEETADIAKKARIDPVNDKSPNVITIQDVIGGGIKEESKAPSNLVGDERIELVLEENPKWNTLIDVLKEIEREVLDNHMKGITSRGCVLVCCRDDRTCYQLRRYLDVGGRKYLKYQWRRFLYAQRLHKRNVNVDESSLPSLVVNGQINPMGVAAAESILLRRAIDDLYYRAMDKMLRRNERRQAQAQAETVNVDEQKQMTLTQMSNNKSKSAATKKKAKSSASTSARKKPPPKSVDYGPIDDTDDNTVLRDVIRQRERREQRMMDLEEDERLSSLRHETDLSEDRDDEDGAQEEADPNDPNALSICNVNIVLSQVDKTQRDEHIQDEESGTQNVNGGDSDNNVSSCGFDKTVYHDFDETELHALPPFQILLHSSADIHQMLLRFEPDYVIMFDPEIAMLRELEVYSALQDALSRHVHLDFLMYENSVEQKRYIASIEAEKAAFDQLVFDKSKMILPTSEPGRMAGLSGSASSAPVKQPKRSILSADLGADSGEDIRGATYQAYQSTMGKATDRNQQSRRGGESVPIVQRVIVDVREFRSSLPSLLHSKNINIVPCTLEVGDYVLSPQICVERKSVPDLFSSFLSGRLFKQMEQMSRHYKSPVLLIEFDRNKPFHLLGRHELGNEISNKHIISKICLLVLHFPTIRFVWSRDSYITCDVFLQLKNEQFQPDLDAAWLAAGDSGALGTVGVGDIGTAGVSSTVSAMDDSEDAALSMTSFDILRRLPGVMSTNIRQIVNNVNSLVELCETPLPKLIEWMGEASGRKLYKFLQKDLTNLFI